MGELYRVKEMFTFAQFDKIGLSRATVYRIIGHLETGKQPEERKGPSAKPITRRRKQHKKGVTSKKWHENLTLTGHM